MSELLHLRAEIERLRADVERFKASAGMWRNKCYELGGAPLPWEPEEMVRRAVEEEREACALAASIALDEQRELIASWVADMCQGLDANTIAEAIRNGGNDAVDNFEVRK